MTWSSFMCAPSWVWKVWKLTAGADLQIFVARWLLSKNPLYHWQQHKLGNDVHT